MSNNNIPSIESRIIKAFRDDPGLLECPDDLLYRIWLEHVPVHLKMLPVARFFAMIEAGEVVMPNPMTINRIRQDVQQMNPEFWGKLRQLKHEKEMRIAQNLINNKIEKVL